MKSVLILFFFGLTILKSTITYSQESLVDSIKNFEGKRVEELKYFIENRKGVKCNCLTLYTFKFDKIYSFALYYNELVIKIYLETEININSRRKFKKYKNKCFNSFKIKKNIIKKVEIL
jgi:hypothetical protein